MNVSQILTSLTKSNSEELLRELEIVFGDSIFGLMVNGLPEAEPGQTITVKGSMVITMQYVAVPNSKKMIKVCADPEIFNVNYPGRFNVTMSGRQVIEMAQKLPDADGILICSATSFHSLPIYKYEYKHYLGNAASATQRRWWQFWRFPAKSCSTRR
jgi:hypothetical protein